MGLPEKSSMPQEPKGYINRSSAPVVMRGRISKTLDRLNVGILSRKSSRNSANSVARDRSNDLRNERIQVQSYQIKGARK